jgi:Fe-S cluster assembly ATP-binding protein
VSVPILEIKNLTASVGDTPILQGINLTINPGEVHAIMGPNGSGKSTLSKVLVGHPSFEVTGGEVLYKGENLLDQSPEERSRNGIFLAFQYPVEVPGVNNAEFLRMAYNARICHQNSLQSSDSQQAVPQQDELDPLEFQDFLEEKAKLVEMDIELLNNRSVNAGFSGGEKKRNEILQMAVLEPKLALLDETDSGLDIDALRIVANGVNQLRRPDNGMILVTHYQRLLNYIVPDYVHVLAGGQIIRSGGKELALELEEKGYDWLLSTVPAQV